MIGIPFGMGVLPSCEAGEDPGAVLAGVIETRRELRFRITSVLRESGRVVPCSFKKSPHALHSVFPTRSLRHRGVFSVWQLKHSVGGFTPRTGLFGSISMFEDESLSRNEAVS